MKKVIFGHHCYAVFDEKFRYLLQIVITNYIFPHEKIISAHKKSYSDSLKEIRGFNCEIDGTATSLKHQLVFRILKISESK